MEASVYQKIKDTGRLPSPSGVALELMRLVDDETTTISRITATVEADPAIASRLLKLVNCPLSGAARTIASVSTAVKLLGIHTVKNMALGFSLLSANRTGVSKAFDFERFWSESVARAASARNLANHFGCCAADEAFTVALLSRMGQLALAATYPRAYDALLDRVGVCSTPTLVDAERKAFNIDHNNLTAEMMADWRLADVFCESVRTQDAIHAKESEGDSRVDKLARLLHLAGAMAGIMVEPKVYHEDLAALLVTGEMLGMDADLFSAAFDAAKEEWRNVGAVLSVQTCEAPSLLEAHLRASRTQQRILVVDDDPSTLELLTMYLEDAGYEVLTAANGVEALQIIHREECSLVITDWMMPEMDGLDLCRAIRSLEGIGFVYVVILTGRAEKDGLAKAFDAGADDCLTKPCQKQELLSRLKAGVRALTTEAKLARQQRATHKANAELATLNDKLQKMATTDELTGLFNRREAMARLADYWAMAGREGRPLACMVLDIDHFKRCNDTYGHDVGDAVLRATARALQRYARAGETVFRIGGEEFVVLCPGSTAETAAVGAERLRAAVEASRTKCGRMSLSVTMSVGVAERGHRTAKPDDLLKLADEALYEAKRSGRNRVCVAGTDRPPGSRRSSQKPVVVTRTPTCESSFSEDVIGTVLVVDDDTDTRRLFRTLLERDGFQIHEASDGNDALAKAADVFPDVILMDVAMPNMSGLECTRKLKSDQTLSDIPIIIVSGKTDSQHVRAGLEAGAQDYITKPIQPDEFLLRVRTMYQLARGRKDLVLSNGVRGEQARAMQLLFDLSRSLAAAESLDAIVAHTACATAELMNSRRVSVMLPDDTGKNLVVASAIGIDDALAAKILVPVGSDIAGKVFASGEPMVVNSKNEAIDCTGHYESEFFASVPMASRALAVPNKVVGVLNVTERQDRRPFETHEIEYLDLVCNMTASAIEQFQSAQAREHAHAAIVIGLAKLAEHRDSNTGKHLERVTQFALLLARELGKSSSHASTIDDRFLLSLEQAMPLHDIGKVSVPDAILLKPGKLTDVEYTVMKRHADAGANAIQSVIEQAPEAEFLVMARDIAYGHHEWFDGSGYPGNFAGHEIPLAARIAAVVDVYDALTTQRPYKEAFPHEKAVGLIRESSGSHFDPKVVDVFLRIEKNIARRAAELRDSPSVLHDSSTERELATSSTDPSGAAEQQRQGPVAAASST